MPTCDQERSEFDEQSAQRKKLRLQAARQQARKYDAEAEELEAQLEALRANGGGGPSAPISSTDATPRNAPPKTLRLPELPSPRRQSEPVPRPARSRASAATLEYGGRARTTNSTTVVRAYSTSAPQRARVK
eukprot:5796655-Prymnesium_polylepis.2